MFYVYTFLTKISAENVGVHFVRGKQLLLNVCRKNSLLEYETFGWALDSFCKAPLSADANAIFEGSRSFLKLVLRSYS